jgi:site-specific DNA-methyltransferase (adenine-specific)
MLINADCFEALRDMPSNSVEAVVTDPPYGLGACTPAQAAECLQAWSSGKTWKPKGSGFMGKAWDAWVPPPELWREVLRVLKPGGHALVFAGSRTQDLMGMSLRLAGFEMRDVIQWLYGSGFPKSHNVRRATQDEQWEGWGTALKPAYEPALLVRKPLSGTVAQNTLNHGCGGLNVNECRIEGVDVPEGRSRHGGGLLTGYSYQLPDSESCMPAGRWPSNIILDEQASEQLEQQAGTSRFFYTAKASKSEREAGLEGFPLKKAGAMSGEETREDRPTNHPMRANIHPTVKPIDLMRYLIRLITPPHGTVLDPFMGSGSTGCAAALEGVSFIGIEREPEYFAIAQQRVAYWSGDVEALEYPEPAPEEPEQPSLFEF